jgi:uncharacterized protein
MGQKNAICWFEIYVDDIERAKKFYNAELGVEFQDVPSQKGSGDFKMAFLPSDPNPENMGVGGALVQMAGARKDNECQSTNTIVYFPCVDCSVEESRVAASGGMVHKTKFSIGEFGFCAFALTRKAIRSGYIQ